MKIYEILSQRTQLQDVLLGIWERSVRATHLFLADEDVKKIKEYVPQALESVEHLHSETKECDWWIRNSELHADDVALCLNDGTIDM
jgi:hypothetical protein